MKRNLFCLVVVLAWGAVSLGQATGWNIMAPPTTDWWSGNSRDIAWRWARDIDALVGAGAVGNAGTGKTFYVDSNVSNAGDGSSWLNAKATLDAAIALCAVDNGDVIYVAQGHAETWAATTSGVTVDVNGVSIIGCGQGDNVPTFTYTHAGATIDITVDNVRIQNLRFVCGVTAVVSSITLAAGADYLTITGCEWVSPATSTFEFYDMITLATGSDYVTIAGNKFVSLTASTGCNQAINGDAGIVNRLSIIGNEFQGKFTVAAIHSDKVNTNCLVAYNVIHQATASQFAIEFTDDTTGVCMWNTIYSTAGYEIDEGVMKLYGNSSDWTLDLGTNNLDHLMKTAVASGADLTTEVADGTVLSNILDDGGDTSSYDRTKHSLFAIGSDTDTLIGGIINGSGAALPTNKSLFDIIGDEYTDDGANDNADSVAAHLNLLSKYVADGDGDFGTGSVLPANKSLYNILGAYTADGDADDEDTLMAHLDLLYVDTQAVKADTAAMDTHAEMILLTDPNRVSYDAPRLVLATTSNFSGAAYETGDSPVTIFTVTGDIKCRCSAVIGTACTSVNNDGTLELGITGDTACLLIQDVVDGTAFDAGDAWTLISGPDDGSAQENDEWVLIGGGNDIKLTIGTNNMSAGIIKFYLEWVPLSADAAVTAAAP